MTAPRSRFTLRAAIALSALVLAQPALAADFQIDNLRIEFGPLVVTAPQAAVKGSPLDREAFLALFNASSGESAAQRMGRLTAAEITAPQLSYELTFGSDKQITTYRDIRFSNIRDGKIGRAEAPSGTFKAVGGSGPMNGTIAQSSFEDFDLRQTARIFTEKAEAGADAPMTVLLGRLDQGAQAFDMGPRGKIAVGRTSARALAAKPGPTPLGEVVAQLLSEADKLDTSIADPKAEMSPAEKEASKRLGLSILSLFETVDYGSGEMRDIAMTLPVPPDATKPNQKAAGPQNVDLKMARIAYGEDTPAKSGVAIEGMQFSGAGAKGTIDSISSSGFSFGSMLKALQEDLTKPEAELTDIDWRRYVPTIGTIRLAGLSVDAPPVLPTGQPIKISLGTFELTAGEQLNGIPTSLALTIDKLVTPITEGSGNPAARDMIAMGIRSLDLSAKLDLAWEAARNELAIRQISIGGANLARLEASATLGNVTKDLFSSDTALAQVAALGATARGLNAKLENFGLVEKLIANEARKAGRKPEEMRQQYAMIASLGLSAILGPSDAAKALTAAVSRFAAKPGTLTVEASAKSASGLGLADVITITDPTEILEKIDVKATAQ
ncbi:hypothetical protein [Bosea sp. Root381]|uniref:hypothetical protein n=1 Tax=Bosea sp. Root381 TaxID=1736524 RepID=UPI000A840277|nr:hypothetical protein [Bosea sp. Root381]